jgi:hypothetical protein
LGPRAAGAVGTKEVVEDCSIDGLDRSFREAVVVGFNFGALILVGTIGGYLNKVSVPGGKLTECQILALERMEPLTGLETIKLLLLVADSVVFYYNTASKVAQKFKLELATLHWDGGVEVIAVKSLAFVENLFVLVHAVH